MTPEMFQNIIVSILGGGLVAGVFSLLTKKSKSPESQNELARLGDEFASQLLKEAQLERKELRLTIEELEKSVKEQSTSIKTLEESIERLKVILQAKDDRISELEDRQTLLAEKLQHGEKISLTDIFGKDAPDVHIVVDSVA
jgi:predicted nuclease with TOPRIM domain